MTGGAGSAGFALGIVSIKEDPMSDLATQARKIAQEARVASSELALKTAD